MTQELIANMLGVCREGVTEAAGTLQRLGIIEYSCGKITVIDRGRLEQFSCECYAVVKAETDRLSLLSGARSNDFNVTAAQLSAGNEWASRAVRPRP